MSRLFNNLRVETKILVLGMLPGALGLLLACGVFTAGELVMFPDGLSSRLRSTVGVVALASSLALVVTYVVARILQKTITRPLGDVSLLLARMSDGDLTGRVEIRGDPGEVASSTQRLLDRTRGVVEGVGDAEHQLSDASRRIQTATAELDRDTVNTREQVSLLRSNIEEISKEAGQAHHPR